MNGRATTRGVFKAYVVFFVISLTFPLKEQEELLREMTEKAGRPTPEVYMLQKELEKVRAQLRQEQAIGDHEKHHVGNRLQEEVCQSFCEP